MRAPRAHRVCWRTRFSGTVAAAFLGACAATLVSAYDEPTDRMVTALQHTVDSFLVDLSRGTTAPACTYERNKRFYTELVTSVGSLEVRNRARPLNDITVEQVVLLDSSVAVLERLHRAKGETACMSAAEIQPVRRNFNTIFTAILTLELAKRRER